MSELQSSYKVTQILTATPEKLLLMLYDAAISSLEVVISYLQEDKSVRFYDKVNTHLLKVQDIIGELMSGLDLERGGEISSNLQSLYIYFLRKIMHGNLTKTVDPIHEVLTHLRILRDAWRKIYQYSMKTSPPFQHSPSDQKKGGLSISG